MGPSPSSKMRFLSCLILLGFVALVVEGKGKKKPAPCPKKLLGCPPSTVRRLVGKDEKGCPKYECKPRPCPKRLLGCSPSTVQMMVGKDEKGCPKYECKPRPCPKRLLGCSP